MNQRPESLSPEALAQRFDRMAAELLRQADLMCGLPKAIKQGQAAGLALAAHDVRLQLVRAA